MEYFQILLQRGLFMKCLYFSHKVFLPIKNFAICKCLPWNKSTTNISVISTSRKKVQWSQETATAVIGSEDFHDFSTKIKRRARSKKHKNNKSRKYRSRSSSKSRKRSHDGNSHRKRSRDRKRHRSNRDNSRSRKYSKSRKHRHDSNSRVNYSHIYEPLAYISQCRKDQKITKRIIRNIRKDIIQGVAPEISVGERALDHQTTIKNMSGNLQSQDM